MLAADQPDLGSNSDAEPAEVGDLNQLDVLNENQLKQADVVEALKLGRLEI